VYTSAIALRESLLSQSKYANDGKYPYYVDITDWNFIDDEISNWEGRTTKYMIPRCLECFTKYWQEGIDRLNLPNAIRARLVSCSYNLDRLLNEIELPRLPVHSLEKTVVYLPTHPLFNLIEEYQKIVELNPELEAFYGKPKPKIVLIKFLELFGVAKDIRINSIGGVAYTVELMDNNGEWFHLADMGTGTLHLMELFLFVLQYHGSQIIFIEEPEQNLHPKFQSLLCDFFLLARNELGCRYIVETHSEYLVRRSQVLVAEMNCEDEEVLQKQNPFKVFYFPEEGIPYDMGYKVNGYFEEPFGTGFFNEASKWSRQLMLINNRDGNYYH
ncbi:MAG: ATP-binding protein, partial [Allobaculum sp.]|nr:ATP-binding protein [Allobaculum sp.]